MIRIRHHHAGTVAKECRFGAEPVWGQGYGRQIALNAQIEIIFHSRPERRVT